MPETIQPDNSLVRVGLLQVFLIFLRLGLGLSSFGGPVAHLVYFRAEFVTRRRWLSERSYADLELVCPC